MSIDLKKLCQVRAAGPIFVYLLFRARREGRRLVVRVRRKTIAAALGIRWCYTITRGLRALQKAGLIRFRRRAIRREGEIQSAFLEIRIREFPWLGQGRGIASDKEAIAACPEIATTCPGIATTCPEIATAYPEAALPKSDATARRSGKGPAVEAPGGKAAEDAGRAGSIPDRVILATGETADPPSEKI
ncbi:MAG: hypothetical protein N3A38_15185, partial [Planctomycetota bacterium]|nr:hypothetical protein [Planctomycetota bacterium]